MSDYICRHGKLRNEHWCDDHHDREALAVAAKPTDYEQGRLAGLAEAVTLIEAARFRPTEDAQGRLATVLNVLKSGGVA